MQIKLIGKTFICGTKRLKFAGWRQGHYIRRHCDEAVKYSGRKLNKFASQLASPTSQMVTYKIKTQDVDA